MRAVFQPFLLIPKTAYSLIKSLAFSFTLFRLIINYKYFSRQLQNNLGISYICSANATYHIWGDIVGACLYDIGVSENLQNTVQQYCEVLYFGNGICFV